MFNGNTSAFQAEIQGSNPCTCTATDFLQQLIKHFTINEKERFDSAGVWQPFGVTVAQKMEV